MLKRNKLSSLINKTLYKGFVGGGLVIGALTLSACGGGGGGADNDPEVTSLKVYQSTTQLADGQADYVLDGDSANIEYWMDETTGKVTQTLYTSDNGVTKIRTIVDSDGVPTKIIDELTGSYVVVEDTGNDRVNYYTYDANDIYQSGVAVYVENSKIYYATISGIPANLSGQYAGQLQGSQQTGSYTLIASQASTGLSNIQEVDAKYYDFVNSILAEDFDSASNKSMQTVTSKMTQLNSYAISDTSGLSAVSVLSEVLPVAGLALAGAASVSLLAPAYGAAGVCMILAGVGADKLDNFIESNFQVDASENEQKQEAMDIALTYLTETGSDISGFFGELRSNLEDTTDEVTESAIDALRNALNGAVDSIESYTGDLADELSGSEEPQPFTFPPSVPASLTGQATEQDGAIYFLTGEVDGDGEITASGTSTDDSKGISISGSVDSTGNITGTFNTSDGNSGNTINTGGIDGSETALGECAVSQNSGGQGTFSFTHLVGNGQGTVSFTYDAYSIKDEFTVSTANGVKFTTGGLVSGGSTEALTFNDETAVFVSVSAPNSGTLWEYQLGCLVPDSSTGNTNGNTATGDAEPNGSLQSAGVLTSPISGTVDSGSDVYDYYRYTPSVSGAAEITLSGFAGDLDLFVYDANGNELDYSLFSSPEIVTASMVAGETYYVGVQAYSTSGVTSYVLSLAL